VRVRDETNAIYDGLKNLSLQRYMGAMWMLGAELVSLYADEMSESERSLAEATLTVARDVSISGDVERLERRASGLADDWQRVIDEATRGSGGLARTYNTLQAVAAEIAGLVTAYYAAEWVADAGVMRWRAPTGRGFRQVNPREEVAEDSPIAQTLTRFGRIVNGVADAPDWNGDLELLRSRILEN
jgi:hypothetical protein